MHQKYPDLQLLYAFTWTPILLQTELCSQCWVRRSSSSMVGRFSGSSLSIQSIRPQISEKSYSTETSKHLHKPFLRLQLRQYLFQASFFSFLVAADS